MTDIEFLDYCAAQCRTPRAGFVPENLAQLLRLSGDEINAMLWDDMPVQVISISEEVIDPLVKKARERLAAGGA